jgi:Flp pilus assembly protein TadD
LWRIYPAYALLAIAVLSDEVALVTPLLLIGLDRWGSPRIPARGRTTIYAGFVAVAMAGLLARIGAHQLHLSERHELLAPGAGIWGPVLAACEYLRALVVPYPLDAMRSLTAAEAASGTLRLAALASFAALALFVWWRRKDPLARTGALLLVLPLLPALPLPFSQGAYVEERAAYLASVGLCLLAASLYAWISLASGSRERRGAAAGAAIVAILVAGIAAAGTMKRLPVWKDNLALLSDALRHDPKDPAVHLALADQYSAMANYEQALASLDRAVALDSTDAVSYHKRMLLLNRLGRYPEAEAAARRSVALSPKDAIYWANLGDLLLREGKTREALETTRTAVMLDSTNAENWYNFGVSLASSDSLARAIGAYRRAIAINPGHFQAINNLGASLASSGRMQEARDAYAKAVEVQPMSVELRMNLALASLHLGDTQTASTQRAVIEKLDPAAAQQLLQAIKQIEAAKGGPPQGRPPTIRR